jgi:hypothetical protein
VRLICWRSASTALASTSPARVNVASACSCSLHAGFALAGEVLQRVLHDLLDLGCAGQSVALTSLEHVLDAAATEQARAPSWPP